MFKNVSVLVTGGASSFGRATAERFGKHGASVMLCDQASSNGEQIAKEIGPNVSFMSADITNESDVINLVKEIKQKYGRLNLLVNCPSVESKKPIYDFEQKQPQQLEGFQSILKTNVLGTLNVIRLASQLMGGNEPDPSNLRGLVINMAHASGVNAKKEDTSNAAASAAIIGMNRSLARDLGQLGIRAVTIVPNSSLKHPSNIDGTTDPNDFAAMVQTCLVNTYINATTVNV